MNVTTSAKQRSSLSTETKVPTVAEGEWLEPGLIWHQADLIYVSTAYLRRREFGDVVNPTQWNIWIERQCRDLDSRVNDGRIRSLLILDHGKPGEGGGRKRFFALPDVKQIIQRRTDAKASKADPAQRGEWLDNDFFILSRDVPEMGLVAGDLLCRDQRLAEEAGVKSAMPVYWRRNRHPNLKQTANAGRMRWLRVPRLRRSQGPAMVIVSSWSDWKKIIGTRTQQQRARTDPGNGKVLPDVAKNFGLKSLDDQIGLSFVLRKFREEVPTGAWLVTIWDQKRNRGVDRWHHDTDAFRKWLGGRTVEEVAAGLRRLETAKVIEARSKRLRRAVAFLMFVLTRGSWSARSFERFLVDPPVGATIMPCDGVATEDIKRWAKEAKVSVKQRKAARKLLPIRTRMKGGLTGARSGAWPSR